MGENRVVVKSGVDVERPDVELEEAGEISRLDRDPRFGSAIA